MTNPRDVSTLAAMWQRIAPSMATAIRAKTPMSVSVLILPNATRRRVAAAISGSRDHPQAYWHNEGVVKGSTLEATLITAERRNASQEGLLKMRLHFTDGSFLELERKAVGDPRSLTAVRVYSPNGAFDKATEEKAQTMRATALRALKPLTDLEGRHHPPLSFATREDSPLSYVSLFRDCPIPTVSRMGFTFTPVSCLSFINRGNHRFRGCRPDLAKTNPEAVHYRPRSYRRGPRVASCHDEHAEELLIPRIPSVQKAERDRAMATGTLGSTLRRTLGGEPMSDCDKIVDLALDGGHTDARFRVKAKSLVIPDDCIRGAATILKETVA